ncbi:winged helix-turn-helix domain-containing protein [Methylomonas rivi]|uniref:Winged helix-turn-helix domain-containing protein n=1 Tax=Methylomonas rivi TaxID=2952226 RepID=A0ABT1UB11_9GAMM|nr:winged helix-turn-helix domain-containing protein [Methylomonas sp. WSC-6]MCQ8131049.1 winged helix-turn-helix domain-containing protein [Methylomonas sp. WSC-6]
MKKTNASTETPAAKVKVEPAVAPKAAAESAPKKTGTRPAPEKKPATVAPKAKAEPAVPAVAADTAAKKPSPKAVAPAKTKAKASKPEATAPELPMHERVGLTAGSIWHYLSGNGETSVAKLIKELPEEEKIIQRGIGWLAQEDKISIAIADRIEVVALK